MSGGICFPFFLATTFGPMPIPQIRVIFPGPAECAERSAAHRRCAGRAELELHRCQPKLQIYHKWLSSWWQAQVLALKALTPLSFSLPRSLGTTADPAPRSGKMGLCGFFFRFFAVPSCDLNFASKKHRKKCENQGFWLPKPLPKRGQNPFKIDVPKNMRFFTDFCSIFAACCKSQHRFRIGFYNTKWLSDVFLQVAFCMDLGSKKLTKNPWKTMSEPL